jgi:hypothetical protein
MHCGSLVAALLILSLPSTAVAQGWTEYTNMQDGFLINFPGQPAVRDLAYRTEFGLTLPARVYTALEGGSRYTVTVVDFSNAAQMHTDRVKGCTGYPDTCIDRGPNDLRGALDHVISGYLQRGGKVTYYGHGDTDRIAGRRLQFVNADGTQTLVATYMHDNRLFILDGTVTPQSPPPALFYQSLGIFDKDGLRIRYVTVYTRGYPPPPREKAEGRLQGC